MTVNGELRSISAETQNEPKVRWITLGSILGIVGGAVLLCPGSAYAECHFKLPVALVCSTGYGAVTAYRSYGFDTRRIYTSESARILVGMQCSRVRSAKFGNAKIEQISHGRVAFSDGWESVTTINLLDRDIWVVDDHYLIGRCERYVPGTFVLQPTIDPR